MINHNIARDIVCDALSGITNLIPNTAESEKLQIAQALRDAAAQNKQIIFGFYDYIKNRLHHEGYYIGFLPGQLAAPTFTTLGELVRLVVSTSIPV